MSYFANENQKLNLENESIYKTTIEVEEPNEPKSKNIIR